MDGVLFPTISLDEKRRLEREFEEEISEALSACKADKTPGPYGFNFAFLKAAWGIVKELCDMLSEFHEGWLNLEINSTFLLFIPKVPNPVELKDFRAISLVGCV